MGRVRRLPLRRLPVRSPRLRGRLHGTYSPQSIRASAVVCRKDQPFSSAEKSPPCRQNGPSAECMHCAACRWPRSSKSSCSCCLQGRPLRSLLMRRLRQRKGPWLSVARCSCRRAFPCCRRPSTRRVPLDRSMGRCP